MADHTVEHHHDYDSGERKTHSMTIVASNLQQCLSLYYIHFG